MTGRQRLPNRRASVVVDFEHDGHRYRAGASRFADGRLAEVFLDVGKAASAVQAHANSSAILTSLLLQHGVAAETIAHSITGPIVRALELIEGAS